MCVRREIAGRLMHTMPSSLAWPLTPNPHNTSAIIIFRNDRKLLGQTLLVTRHCPPEMRERSSWCALRCAVLCCVCALLLRVHAVWCCVLASVLGLGGWPQRRWPSRHSCWSQARSQEKRGAAAGAHLFIWIDGLIGARTTHYTNNHQVRRPVCRREEARRRLRVDGAPRRRQGDGRAGIYI